MDNPSARVTRIASPVSSPGNCGVCGTTESPNGFADARLDFEFYGTFYMCENCAGEFARLFGYLSPDEFSTLRAQNEAQQEELNVLRQAILGLESTVDGLITDASRRLTTNAERIERHRADAESRVVVSDPVDESDEGPTDEGSKPPVKPQPGSGNRPDEPRNERGRDNLLDTSSADELLGLV